MKSGCVSAWRRGALLIPIIFLASLPSSAEELDASRSSSDAVSQAAPIVFICTVGVDCIWAVSTQSYGGGKYLATINMGVANFRRLDVYSFVCNQSGWTLHLADSPTCDGWAGDGATSDHDAEGYLYDTGTFEFFSTGDFSRSVGATFAQSTNAFPTSGCAIVHFTVYHDGGPTSTFMAEANGRRLTVKSLHGMKLGYSACSSSSDPRRSVECDWEDRYLADSWKWYLGINGTVRNPWWRPGLGAQETCVVLSSSISYNPTSCLQ